MPDGHTRSLSRRMPVLSGELFSSSSTRLLWRRSWTEPLGTGTFAYMDDTELVKTVAADYIKRLGRDAVPPHLRRQEARASQHGDTLSAEAWHDIADAAASIERPPHLTCTAPYS